MLFQVFLVLEGRADANRAYVLIGCLGIHEAVPIFYPHVMPFVYEEWYGIRFAVTVHWIDGLGLLFDSVYIDADVVVLLDARDVFYGDRKLDGSKVEFTKVLFVFVSPARPSRLDT